MKPLQAAGALATTLLSLSGCASPHSRSATHESTDFARSGTTEQRIELGNAHRIVVECFCPTRATDTTGAGSSVKLVSTGTYSSAGYHGKQDVPEQFDPKWFEFEAKHEGDTLRLISPEYTYIHHALRIGSLVVEVPTGVEVVFDLVRYDELEGRSSGN